MMTLICHSAWLWSLRRVPGQELLPGSLIIHHPPHNPHSPPVKSAPSLTGNGDPSAPVMVGM